MIKNCYKRKPAKFTVNYNDLLNEVITKQGIISNCFSLFHNYSLHNQMLAYYQIKSKGLALGPINSFTGWNNIGRQIIKGSEALYLWQPTMIKEKVNKLNKDTKKVEQVEEEKLIFSFKPRWFTYAQTISKNGEEDMKIENLKIKDFDFSKVYNAFNITIINYDKVNGNIQGYANTKEGKIAINPMAEDKETTLLHEIAHVVLKHYDAKYSHALKEVEAESVAYIVASFMGIEENKLAKCRGYVQAYLKDNKIPDTNARHIFNAADKIIKAGIGKEDKK